MPGHSNGDGTFQAAVAYAVGASPYGITAADLDGDGKLDLVVACQAGALDLLVGNGDGTFQSATPFPGGNATALTVADFDRDGKLDVAVSNASSGDLSIYLNTSH